MVTINWRRLSEGWACEVSCLAGDEKPIEGYPPGIYPAGPVPIPNGARLTELTTGEEFRFDGAAREWLPTGKG